MDAAVSSAAQSNNPLESLTIRLDPFFKGFTYVAARMEGRGGTSSLILDTALLFLLLGSA